MNKQDWNDYANYLKSQVNTKTVSDPNTIGEAYNNFQHLQDLENVMRVELGVKPTKYVRAKA